MRAGGGAMAVAAAGGGGRDAAAEEEKTALLSGAGGVAGGRGRGGAGGHGSNGKGLETTGPRGGKGGPGEEEVYSVEEALALIGHQGWHALLLDAALGFCFFGFGAATYAVSILSACIEDDWFLSEEQTGVADAMLFAGSVLGALIIGPFADKYGRIVMLRTSMIVLFSGVTLTAFSSHYVMYCIGLFITGIGVVGKGVVSALTMENASMENKAKALATIQIWWMSGNVFVSAVSWATLPENQWRWLVGSVAGLPIAALFLLAWLPESVHWYYSRGMVDETVKALHNLAKLNRVSDFPERLQLVPPEEYKIGRNTRHGHVRDLFSTLLIGGTSVACIIRMCAGWNFFGLQFLITEDLSNGDSSDCSYDYTILLLTNLAGVFGQFICVGTITSLNPYVYFAWSNVFLGISSAITGFDIHLWLTAISAIMARIALATATGAEYVIVGELFPTEVRATGYTFSSIVSSIGALMAAYFEATSTSVEFGLTILFFTTLAACAAIATHKGIIRASSHMGE